MKKYESLKQLYLEDLKTRQGELILPYNFGEFKFKREEFVNFWVSSKVYKKSFFKMNDSVNDDLAEIIYSLLAQELGIDVVDVYPAIRLDKDGNVKKGVLVENFISSPTKTKEIPADKLLEEFGGNNAINNIENLVKAYVNLAKHYKKHSKKEVVFDDAATKHKLLCMHLLDVLTFNTDRHKHNIAFLLTENKDKIVIEMSKIYDNSFAFRLNKFRTSKRRNFVSFKRLNKDRFDYFKLSINQYQINSRYNELLEELADYSKTDVSFYKMYNEIINYDINNLFERFKEKYPDYKLTKRDANYIRDALNFSKQNLENAFSGKLKGSKISKQKGEEQIL